MKKFVFILLASILVYTRFVNIGWGLPYPMHPDERNMANAIQSLNCNFKFEILNLKLNECFNPHFFAYGQLPLYIAYGGIQVYHGMFGLIGQPTYVEATIALRIISAISSILLVFVLLKIIESIYPQKNVARYTLHVISILFFTFSPYAIQLSHFGTTESILMLFYALIIYLSLKLLTTNHQPLTTILLLALFSGLALGTKISSLLFLGVPFLIFFTKVAVGVTGRDRIYRTIINLFFYLSITIFFFLLSSPHNFLNWNDFISSITYESRVGLGRFVAFYTRQFVDTTPLLFQFTKILPFALGWPTLIGGMLGFFLLPSFLGGGLFHLILQVSRVKGTRQHAQTASQQALAGLEYWRGKLRVTESAKLIDILRFALLLSFLPPSFFFSKWTRFIAPSFPLFSLFALLFFLQIAKKNIKNIPVMMIIIIITAIPGLSYLSIYLPPDVRFTTSEWMYKNIPAGNKILTETANAIDLPITTPYSLPPTTPYLINSFNFYDLDQSFELQNNLNTALEEADYIIIPSRRIFSNHTCLSPNSSQIIKNETGTCRELKKTYPLLNAYYRDLFSGKLGFQKVAELNSFPKISFMGKTLLEFPDENAEETWTVFDHPVIRIYKRVDGRRSMVVGRLIDFSQYKTMNYQLTTNDYRLLIADTPEKWKNGLMFVENKGDIGGLDGMIFTFPDSQIRTFWNKNTLSHLTLYWIQNNEVVGTSDLPSIMGTQIITTVSSPSSVIETQAITTVSSPSSVDMVIEIIK